MRTIGYKSQVDGAEYLASIQIVGYPASLPELEFDDVVICGHHQGGHEVLTLCETLTEMQSPYDSDPNCKWYVGSYYGFSATI